MFPRLDPELYPIEDDQRFVLELLRAQHVLVVQGTGFNWPRPDHLRIVTLPRVDDLTEAIGRIGTFLDDLPRRLAESLTLDDVSRRLVNLTLDNLGDLSPGCRRCVFWELDAAAGQRACADGSAELEKEAWVSDTLLEWGCCGQLVYVDGAAAGHVLYAPPAYVPRSMGFATSPVGPDAVLLMSAHVDPDYAGGGPRPDAGAGRRARHQPARHPRRRGVRAHRSPIPRTATSRSTPACRRSTSCWRWDSRRCVRTTARRDCGWTSAASCRGRRTSSTPSSGYSAPSPSPRSAGAEVSSTGCGERSHGPDRGRSASPTRPAAVRRVRPRPARARAAARRRSSA